VRAADFPALHASLGLGRVKALCRVARADAPGARVAVLTGALPGGPAGPGLPGGVQPRDAILAKYLDGALPAAGLITRDDLATEAVLLDITQIIPAVE